MIGFFPIPYPDEILYSVFARYHARSKNKSLAPTVHNLFGDENSRIVVDLPNKLGYLVNQLPPGSKITVKRLIDDHTLFPFYALFMPPDRVKLLRQDMKSKTMGGVIHGRVGMLTSNIQVEYLRYCVLCAEKDVQLHGQAYWHRAHQLPGIIVCPHHSVFLEESGVKCNYDMRGDTLVTAQSEINTRNVRSLDTNNKDHLAYLYIAEQGNWLLQQKSLQYGGPKFFRTRYLQILYRKNLAGYRDVKSMSEIKKEFQKFHSTELLCSLSSDKLDNEKNWISRLLQNSTKFKHPIRNILFLHFLGYSLDEFVKLPEIIYPFGKGPFPCLNPTSDHFMNLIIDKVTISKSPSNNKITGTFKCECGFVYRRYDWDEEGRRKYEYDWILSYGEAFHKRLIELRKDGVIAKEIARLLDVSLGMVNSQLKILLTNNLVPINKPDSSIISASEISKTRKNYRATWLKSRKENPELKRSKLARLNSKNSKIYVWMLSHDKKWFEENSPPKAITEKQLTRVNWEERDGILCAKVEELTKQIWNADGSPVWITVYGIANRLKFAYIVRTKPEKIPKTIQALLRNAESTEEFIVRRIRFAEKTFTQEKNEASYWKLLTRASVMKPHLIKLPKVQLALSESLKRLQQSKVLGWTS